MNRTPGWGRNDAGGAAGAGGGTGPGGAAGPGPHAGPGGASYGGNGGFGRPGGSLGAGVGTGGGGSLGAGGNFAGGGYGYPAPGSDPGYGVGGYGYPGPAHSGTPAYGVPGAGTEAAPPAPAATSSGGGVFSPIPTDTDTPHHVETPHGYQLLRRAGTGRHSTVLLCREEATGQEVAVKLLHLTVAEEGARLATHAELLSAGAAANHPCSVLVEDAGFTGEHRPYLIQQFCRGGNAQAKLVNSGPFPVEEVLVIGVRLALALASSHRRGVLHLDVRPANVLFDDAGDALLADHGVARVVQRSAPQIGAIFDPMYSSRELFGWEKPGPAADVYSLGATLYALLNGLPAYAEAGSTSWAALYNEVLRGELPRPNRPDAPEPLLDLIRRMMSVNPEGRPPLSEVHRVLRMLLPPGLAGRVPALEPEPAPEPMLPGWDPADDVTPEEQAEAARLGAEAQAAEKRRNRRKLIAAGTAVVVFAGAATTMTLLLRKDEAKKKTVAGPSASAAPSASASASSGGGSINLPGGVAPSAQEVAPDKLPALMPQAVTEDASGGKVRVSWKAPKNPDTVTTYFVQASAGEKQVGLAQAPKGQTQVVFTNPEAVKPGVCYTVASVIALSNGQIGYAPAKTICRPHG